ncbi:MAG TPA: 30S ribosomal protein S3 [Synergistaceae bacterium]|nr:30S ribosomal protein S3 [Synergistaceae bacterium]HQK24258.1 30S ribosomal protein S3 [Synergistaceae bacterium]
MGQKVHPVGYRVGVIRDWESRWFASGKTYVKHLHEDLKLRDWIKKRWFHAGVSKVEIERIGNVLRFTVWTARPGVVIGKGGQEIQIVRDELQRISGSRIMINVQEIKHPDMDAQVVSEGVASSLERRISFRRAMKQAIFRAMKSGARGIKIQCSGRLGGAEIARTEWYLEGRLPLSTLRAEIDYGFGEAHTIYGVIGIKVWIYRGDAARKLRKGAVGADQPQAPVAAQPVPNRDRERDKRR